MSYSDNSSSSDDDWNVSSSNINQKLQALKSIVPGMAPQADNRSVLEGALEYLQRVELETEQIQKEIAEVEGRHTHGIDAPSSSGGDHGPRILGIETEEIKEGTFVVKIEWRRGVRGTSDVQRLIESLDMNVSSTFVLETAPYKMLTTVFLEVKREPNMTEEQLQNLIKTAAIRWSLM